MYINGLPPHFPEDQLLAMAAPFGEVRSVRTFTRHVRDSESGYGFVLYVMHPFLQFHFAHILIFSFWFFFFFGLQGLLRLKLQKNVSRR